MRSGGWGNEEGLLAPRARYGFRSGRLPQAIACGSPMSGQKSLAYAVIGQLLAVRDNRLSDLLLPGGVRMCGVPGAAEEPCVGRAQFVPLEQVGDVEVGDPRIFAGHGTDRIVQLLLQEISLGADGSPPGNCF